MILESIKVQVCTLGSERLYKLAVNVCLHTFPRPRLQSLTSLQSNQIMGTRSIVTIRDREGHLRTYHFSHDGLDHLEQIAHFLNENPEATWEELLAVIATEGGEYFDGEAITTPSQCWPFKEYQLFVFALFAGRIGCSDITEVMVAEDNTDYGRSAAKGAFFKRVPEDRLGWGIRAPLRRSKPGKKAGKKAALKKVIEGSPRSPILIE